MDKKDHAAAHGAVRRQKAEVDQKTGLSVWQLRLLFEGLYLQIPNRSPKERYRARGHECRSLGRLDAKVPAAARRKKEMTLD